VPSGKEAVRIDTTHKLEAFSAEKTDNNS